MKFAGTIYVFHFAFSILISLSSHSHSMNERKIPKFLRFVRSRMNKAQKYRNYVKYNIHTHFCTVLWAPCIDSFNETIQVKIKENDEIKQINRKWKRFHWIMWHVKRRRRFFSFPIVLNQMKSSTISFLPIVRSITNSYSTNKP